MSITTMLVTMATMEMEEEEVITVAGGAVVEEEAMVVAEEIVIGTDLESVTMHLGGKR